MIYQKIWFVLWCVLWAVYFALDGFDLGAGILTPFLGRSEEKRSAIRNSIGPVWDGNEVWLMTAGGATFAAFPTAYARLFSELYPAMLLILFGLIFRGVSMEFHGKSQSRVWKGFWDAMFFLGSLITALLFGVAFGNLFRGLPLDAQGYHGTLLTLLNPYSLLVGVLFVLLFVVHGCLWLSMKAGAGLKEPTLRLAGSMWHALLAAAAAWFIWSALGTQLAANYREHPLWLTVPTLGVAALILSKILISRKRPGPAFLATSATILLLAAAGFVGLYPNLMPSRFDPEFSLTIFNASSSVATLRVMTIVALVFVPIVIAYQAWVYRVFRSKSGTAGY